MTLYHLGDHLRVVGPVHLAPQHDPHGAGVAMPLGWVGMVVINDPAGIYLQGSSCNQGGWLDPHDYPNVALVHREPEGAHR